MKFTFRTEAMTTVDNHVIPTKGQGSWANSTSAMFLFKEILWGGLLVEHLAHLPSISAQQ
jgi:hypothetical protein